MLLRTSHSFYGRGLPSIVSRLLGTGLYGLGFSQTRSRISYNDPLVLGLRAVAAASHVAGQVWLAESLQGMILKT